MVSKMLHKHKKVMEGSRYYYIENDKYISFNFDN